MSPSSVHTKTRTFSFLARLSACVALCTLLLGGCDALNYYPDGNSSDERKPVPVVPPPPDSLSAGEVEKALAINRRMGESFKHSIEEFDYLLEAFHTARTKKELNMLATSALMTIHHLSDDYDKKQLKAILARTFNAVNPADFDFPIGDIGANECDITFDTPVILDGFTDDAEFTFTGPSYKWWEQGCGQGRMVVESSFYNHYHLAYEAEDIELCTIIEPGAEGMGREMPAGVCDRVNPTAEPRDLAPHWGNEIFVVRRLDNGDNPMPFNFERITNTFSNPIEVRFKKADGTWNGWSSLGGYTIWNLAPYANNVVEVHISHANAQPSCGPDWVAIPGGECDQTYGPIAVDNFEISI